MAYTQARSGIVRSGAFLSGAVSRNITITINGTDRSSSVRDDFTIHEAASQPMTCTFQLAGFTPTIGHDVKVTWQTPAVYAFAGTIVRLTAQAENRYRDAVWTVECVDYTWLMDRYALVNRRFEGVDVNTAIWRILDEFTDGGFTLGGCSQGSQNLVAVITDAVSFENARVSDVIATLATMNGDCSWFMNPDKSITLSNGTNADIGRWAFRQVGNFNSLAVEHVTFTQDLSQAVTRAVSEGEPAPLAASIVVGATTLTVASIGQFGSSGTARIGPNIITYSGASSATDADGNVVTRLTGVSGVAYDAPAGALVVPRSSAEDTAAQTELESILGGGLSGVIESILTPAHAGGSIVAGDAEAHAERTAGTGIIQTLEFDTYLELHPSDNITPNMTTPISVAVGGFVRSVTLTRVRRNGLDDFYRHVVVSPPTGTLTEIVGATLMNAGVAS